MFSDLGSEYCERFNDDRSTLSSSLSGQSYDNDTEEYVPHKSHKLSDKKLPLPGKVLQSGDYQTRTKDWTEEACQKLLSNPTHPIGKVGL